jgi:hypothetical protein
VIVPQRGREVTKVSVSRTAWNRRPQRVKAPYAKALALPKTTPEYDRARETRSESAGTTPQG